MTPGRIILSSTIMVALIALMIGCSSAPSRRAVDLPSVSAISPLQKKVVAAAKKRLGVPYCYGGTNNCMDCSGLIVTIYQDIGIALPRTSSQQFSIGKQIEPHKATVGDLIFFRNKDGNINHVGLYVGDNKLLHASSSKGVIVQTLSDSYLTKAFAGIRRVLPDNAIN